MGVTTGRKEMRRKPKNKLKKKSKRLIISHQTL
jgi:hypothetical protein